MSREIKEIKYINVQEFRERLRLIEDERDNVSFAIAHSHKGLMQDAQCRREPADVSLARAADLDARWDAMQARWNRLCLDTRITAQ
jgi:hypothetical protein